MSFFGALFLPPHVASSWSTIIAGKLVLVSNRLPITITRREDGSLDIKQSSGGLATGMRALFTYGSFWLCTSHVLKFLSPLGLGRQHKATGGKWIGWPGTCSPTGDVDSTVKHVLEERGYIGVGLTEEEYLAYYVNFANSCIW